MNSTPTKSPLNLLNSLFQIFWFNIGLVQSGIKWELGKITVFQTLLLIIRRYFKDFINLWN